MIIGITFLSNFTLLYLLLAAKSELEKSRLRDAAKRTSMQLELYKSKQEPDGEDELIYSFKN